MQDASYRVFLGQSSKDKDFVGELYRMVLKDLGQLEKAGHLLRKARQAFLTRFGPDHPHTRTVPGDLGGMG